MSWYLIIIFAEVVDLSWQLGACIHFYFHLTMHITPLFARLDNYRSEVSHTSNPIINFAYLISSMYGLHAESMSAYKYIFHCYEHEYEPRELV